MAKRQKGATVSAEVEAQVWRQLVQAADGDGLEPSEKVRLMRQMGWSRNEFDRAEQVARRTAHFRRQAGSAADRVKLGKVAQDATVTRQKRAPEIQEAIHQLEKELRSLEQAETATKRRIEDAEIAVGELRKRCPSCVTEVVKFEVEAVELEHGDPMRETGNRSPTHRNADRPQQISGHPRVCRRGGKLLARYGRT